MIASTTPKLDAAVAELTTELRHMDARLTLSAALDPKAVTLEIALRAMAFHARLRNTLKELETSKCK